jgi:hypothetical protein
MRAERREECQVRQTPEADTPEEFDISDCKQEKRPLSAIGDRGVNFLLTDCSAGRVVWVERFPINVRIPGRNVFPRIVIEDALAL